MTPAKEEPRHLTDEFGREMARRIRDQQWEFAERVQANNPLWFCVWNKERRPELADEFRCALMSGLEILHWMDVQHPEWFEKGDWDGARYAFPVKLTASGRTALLNRALYDMEPVFGGLVEPGWQAIPLPSGETP